MTFDLAGRLTVGVGDDDAAAQRLLVAHMDPFRARADGAGAADVPIVAGLPRPRAPLDVQRPARDGLVTAYDGERFLLLADDRACAVPDPLGEHPVALAHEPGFPLGRHLRTLVRPTLQLAILRGGAAAVHAASVELGGRAIVVAGWSESGKTETALALMERGARFLSDKWTVVGADAEVSAFPIGVGVRRWALPYLPTLERGLPRHARTRLRAAGFAAGASRPLRARGAPHFAGAFAARAVTVADRAALAPSELRAAYGQTDDAARRLPLGAVALLTTVPGGEVACRPVDAAWAASRLARSAAYERRDLGAIFERRRYALGGDAGNPVELAIARERDLLQAAFARARVVEVRAPFPVDPRTVADAVARAL